MEELHEFEMADLISKYIDGVATKEEKALVEKMLKEAESFLQLFLDTYELVETLDYINKND